MPVSVKMWDFLNETEVRFEVSKKQDYAKVGFAAARWARAALRNARLGEGSASALLHMDINFAAANGAAPSEEAAETGEERPPKPRRRKKRS